MAKNSLSSALGNAWFSGRLGPRLELDLALAPHPLATGGGAFARYPYELYQAENRGQKNFEINPILDPHGGFQKLHPAT
jgi:hypothetical protein